MIDRLDRIVDSLDSIKQNQSYLYQSLAMVNTSINRLSNCVTSQSEMQSYLAQSLAERVESMRTIEQKKVDELHALRQVIDR